MAEPADAADLKTVLLYCARIQNLSRGQTSASRTSSRDFPKAKDGRIPRLLPNCRLSADTKCQSRTEFCFLPRQRDSFLSQCLVWVNRSGAVCGDPRGCCRDDKKEQHRRNKCQRVGGLHPHQHCGHQSREPTADSPGKAFFARASSIMLSRRSVVLSPSVKVRPAINSA
jgi:hypothetical protein